MSSRCRMLLRPRRWTRRIPPVAYLGALDRATCSQRCRSSWRPRSPATRSRFASTAARSASRPGSPLARLPLRLRNHRLLPGLLQRQHRRAAVVPLVGHHRLRLPALRLFRRRQRRPERRRVAPVRGLHGQPHQCAAVQVHPGADPRHPHAHRVQPGLLLAVVAALGVLEQFALHLDPRAVHEHRDVAPPLPARLRHQRHQPPADQPRALPQALPRRRVHPLQVFAEPPAGGHGPQPARSAGDGIGPKASTAWRCPPRRRRPRRAAPAAARRCHRTGGAGGGPRRPASRAAPRNRASRATTPSPDGAGIF